MSKIAVSMRWEANLAASDRCTRFFPGFPSRVRQEVQDWQDELALELAASLEHMHYAFELGPQVIVDVEMFAPLSCFQQSAPGDYLKSVLEGVAAGTGIALRDCIPIVRRARYVEREDSGFLIKVYPADFAGHGLTGIIEMEPGPTGRMIIALEDDLPATLVGSRVKVNVGVIHA